jgi:cathepsin D
MNLGGIGNGLCLGALFDFNAALNTKPQPGLPTWFVGDTFLVRFFGSLVLKDRVP